METVISGSSFIDPVRLGVRRPDQGFKEVLQRIHEKTAGSTLNKTTNKPFKAPEFFTQLLQAYKND